MPGTILPTLSADQVRSKNSAKQCFVTLGAKVYDITPFLDDHPGGAELITQYGGRDVDAIMRDEVLHAHSESAFDIMDEYLVGFVATEVSVKDVNAVDLEPTTAAYSTTGMSCADDLNKETDLATDYKTHKFLDLERPLLMQVWNGGFSREFYLEQVHRPRHYKGGASAPLFGNFLEPLSLTAWWVVPLVWVPAVVYGTVLAGQQLSLPALLASWMLGLGIWTIVEYGMHRCLFHIDQYLPDNRVGITLHFLLHGIHHYLPMDKMRLVMPPTLFVLLATPFWHLAHFLVSFNWHVATAVFCGGIFGYICYDLTHYFLHHRT